MKSSRGASEAEPLDDVIMTQEVQTMVHKHTKMYFIAILSAEDAAWWQAEKKMADVKNRNLYVFQPVWLGSSTDSSFCFAHAAHSTDVNGCPAAAPSTESGLRR